MSEKNILKRNEILSKKLISAFEKRHFEAYYCETKEDAKNLISSLISKEDTIGWGGSVTLDEIGIKTYLEENGYKVINRDKAQTPEEKQTAVRQSLSANVFMMSANAISEDGELVNIDGVGSRIAALCYGPDKVIVVAGLNKVVKTLEDAVSRARNIAAPVNNQRIASVWDIDNPCLKTGSCHDCKSPSSICSQIHITRLCFPKGRIKVVLVNENLGY